MQVGVIGAGTMGSGIAQVAAQAGHSVVLYDARKDAVDKAMAGLQRTFDRMVEKGKLSDTDGAAILGRIAPAHELGSLAGCGLVIEAIIEDLAIKKGLFRELEELVPKNAVLATNTSSLSVTAIAAACALPARVVGLHFFNPAPLLPLVEVVPGMATMPDVTEGCSALMQAWRKVPVVAKDTPGFIVNRLARPFYGEALRIFEEGIADMATIDHAMRTVGGFRMGPFELMDLIGNDINFAVTRSVFEAFFFDPRYRPSFTQQRMVEAGWLGRKSGRGYYDYSEGEERPEPTSDVILHENICWRIQVMLINEAVDALFLGIASKEALDLAMTKGVNYPQGPLALADAKGLSHCLTTLDGLHAEYGEDRYRPSPLLRRMVREGRSFLD
ncbi:MAG: 3-hydroxybutyryl-CoA dehydrogenase [Flavobacteriales bacterium]|nr:3-hydroxybutyryl-CoA dehydrogenase [Flavobacteriales bacterium]